MEKQKINQILMQYKDFIPQDKILYIKSALEKADEDIYDDLCAVKLTNPNTTLLLSIFLGYLGVDRFYIGDIGLGICKIVFGYFTFGIWPLIDIFLSHKKSKEKNFQTILSIIQFS